MSCRFVLSILKICCLAMSSLSIDSAPRLISWVHCKVFRVRMGWDPLWFLFSRCNYSPRLSFCFYLGPYDSSASTSPGLMEAYQYNVFFKFAWNLQKHLQNLSTLSIIRNMNTDSNEQKGSEHFVSLITSVPHYQLWTTITMFLAGLLTRRSFICLMELAKLWNNLKKWLNLRVASSLWRLLVIQVL